MPDSQQEHWELAAVCRIKIVNAFAQEFKLSCSKKALDKPR
jgi:hypothetical protein